MTKEGQLLQRSSIPIIRSPRKNKPIKFAFTKIQLLLNSLIKRKLNHLPSISIYLHIFCKTANLCSLYIRRDASFNLAFGIFRVDASGCLRYV